jgi:uncharacterized protein YecT (DUF1311 family)
VRKIVIALTFLVSSTALADGFACNKIMDLNAQRTCVVQNVQIRNKEIEYLQKAIMQSPSIPEKDKRIFYKDQSEWIANINSVCDAEPYCMNSELEQRINDLSAYLASFAKRK